jgi:hypothetical protein
LHKNANMRTSIDFPDPLFRTLKASAAMQGTSLRDHVLQLIERGMQQTAQPQAKREPRAVPPIPTIRFREAVDPAAFLMTNEQINQILDNDEIERYERVMRQLEKPHGGA